MAPGKGGNGGGGNHFVNATGSIRIGGETLRVTRVFVSPIATTYIIRTGPGPRDLTTVTIAGPARKAR